MRETAVILLLLGAAAAALRFLWEISGFLFALLEWVGTPAPERGVLAEGDFLFALIGPHFEEAATSGMPWFFLAAGLVWLASKLLESPVSPPR